MVHRVAAGAAVSVIALALAASASARPAVYGAITKDGSPVVITVAGKKVTSMTLHWIASCPSGNVVTYAGVVRYAGKYPLPAPPNLTIGKSSLYTSPLAKSGSFKGNVYGMIDLGSSVVAQVTGLLSGKLGARGGSGSYTMLVTVMDLGSGQMLERCDTAAQWKATRNARTFGGSTSQGEPLVVVLNTARTKVTEFAVGYRLDCPEGQFLELSERFFFGVRGGRFGATFDDDVALSEGGVRKFHYDFAGGVKGAASTGRFTVTTMDTDAAGTVQPQGCATPSVTWKAQSG